MRWVAWVGVVATLAVNGCTARSEAEPLCQPSERLLLLRESFEGLMPMVALSGTAEMSSSTRHTGLHGVYVDNGTGTLRTTVPLPLHGPRVGFGFWETNSSGSGGIVARVSIDGGLTFVASTTPMPTFDNSRTWGYTEAAFLLEDGAADAIFELAITVDAGDVWVDDIVVLDNPCEEVVAPPVIPEGMVWVAPTATMAGFWIDQFEAILDVDTGIGNGDQSTATDLYDGSTTAVAVTRADVMPRFDITWYQARAACQNTGKRLCTRIEHDLACSGSLGFTFPYGDNTVYAHCNSDSSNGYVVETTGSHPDCVSEAGAYDLVGNVREWVEDGGAQNSAQLAGGGLSSSPNCSTTGGATPTSATFDLGFRCCRDAD